MQLFPITDCQFNIGHSYNCCVFFLNIFFCKLCHSTKWLCLTCLVSDVWVDGVLQIAVVNQKIWPMKRPRSYKMAAIILLHKNSHTRDNNTSESCHFLFSLLPQFFFIPVTVEGSKIFILFHFFYCFAFDFLVDRQACRVRFYLCDLNYIELYLLFVCLF